MDAPLLFADLSLEQRIDFAMRGTGALFVTGEDNLRLRSLNAATGVTLAVTGRFLRLDGQIQPLQFSHTPNTDRTLATTLHKLGAGWLLDLRIIASGGTPIIGQCWALLELVRGFTGAITDMSTLVSGCVTATQPLTWPGTPARGTLDGRGAIRSIAGTNPAAGSEILETVPTGARWRLLSFDASLLTDATAGNREAALLLDDGASTLIKVGSGQAHGASTTYEYVAADFGTQPPVTGFNLRAIPLPPVILLAGYRIRTSTYSFVAGDNWTAPQMLVEEWLEGN